MYSRNAVVDLVNSWVGKKESDGSYKSIIDIYNSYKGQLPRNIKMEYSWAWCACTWSALAIKLGYTPIMPIEISCGYLVENAKTMGCWVENDAYVPKIGDAILYDWDDSGIGDNTGWPDHVGTVTYVDTNSGYFVVTEGNASDEVKKRTILINGRYIRGFIAPKYDEDYVTPSTNGGGKDLKTVAHEVIAGEWGNMPERKERLELWGYNYDEVQAEVNRILNGSADKEEGHPASGTPNVVERVAYAKTFDAAIAGSYKATEDLYLRLDAGTNKKAIAVIPKGREVCNYGYYTEFNGTKWFLVSVLINNTLYEGFCSSKYLVKK